MEAEERPTMSARYRWDIKTSYRVAVDRVAARIIAAPPAILPDDPQPTFNALRCSIILAAAFDEPRRTVLDDLQALTVRR